MLLALNAFVQTVQIQEKHITFYVAVIKLDWFKPIRFYYCNSSFPRPKTIPRSSSHKTGFLLQQQCSPQLILKFVKGGWPHSDERLLILYFNSQTYTPSPVVVFKTITPLPDSWLHITKATSVKKKNSSLIWHRLLTRSNGHLCTRQYRISNFRENIN